MARKTNKKRKQHVRRKPRITKRNPYFNVGGHIVKARSYKIAIKKALRTHRNVGGYIDASGEFHPIRDSKGYSRKKAGETKHRKFRPEFARRNAPKMRGRAPKNRWIKARAVKISRGKIFIKK